MGAWEGMDGRKQTIHKSCQVGNVLQKNKAGWDYRKRWWGRAVLHGVSQVGPSGKVRAEPAGRSRRSVPGGVWGRRVFLMEEDASRPGSQECPCCICGTAVGTHWVRGRRCWMAIGFYSEWEGVSLQGFEKCSNRTRLTLGRRSSLAACGEWKQGKHPRWCKMSKGWVEHRRTCCTTHDRHHKSITELFPSVVAVDWHDFPTQQAARTELLASAHGMKSLSVPTVHISNGFYPYKRSGHLPPAVFVHQQCILNFVRQTVKRSP